MHGAGKNNGNLVFAADHSRRCLSECGRGTPATHTVPLATMGVTYFVGPMATGAPAVPKDVLIHRNRSHKICYTRSRHQVDSIKTWPIARSRARDDHESRDPIAIGPTKYVTHPGRQADSLKNGTRNHAWHDPPRNRSHKICYPFVAGR